MRDILFGVVLGVCLVVVCEKVNAFYLVKLQDRINIIHSLCPEAVDKTKDILQGK